MDIKLSECGCHKKSNLAELKRLDKRLLDSNEQREKTVYAFFLALFLLYNDLRDFQEWVQDAEYRSDVLIKKIGDSTPNENLGHLSGMKIHLIRLSTSQIFEFLVLLKEKQTAPVVHELNEIFNCLVEGSTVRKQWEKFTDIAKGKKGGSGKRSVWNLLWEIRNKSGFHYDIDSLTKGYEFHMGKNIPHTKHIFYSLGTSLETSRFHFADGAAQGHIERSTANKGISLDEVRELIVAMHRVLYPILGTFLSRRGPIAET